MKRIVLCFDGTWNKPADEKLPSDSQVETNVRRFYESMQETGTDGIKQVKLSGSVHRFKYGISQGPVHEEKPAALSSRKITGYPS
jgi:hypothetical protein